MNKSLFHPLVFWLIYSILLSCSKKVNDDEMPLCDSYLCAQSSRLNGELLDQFNCNELTHYLFADKYLVFTASQTDFEQVITFRLRIGNVNRPVYIGPGTFGIDNFGSAFLSYEITGDTASRYLAYSGSIRVDEAGPNNLKGSFDVRLKADHAELYQALTGSFQLAE